jgi:hypothetical protein
LCARYGSTAKSIEAAQAVYLWVKEKSSINTMQNNFTFFTPTEAGKAHEAGTYIEYQWQKLIANWKEWEKFLPEHFTSPRLLIEVAIKRPQLRMLFPWTSHNTLHFSCTTGYPFTWDCPYAVPLGNDKYMAFTKETIGKKYRCEIIGEGPPNEVIEMLINHLPQDCGPAVDGTAVDHKKE